jgi:hypothetical protein
MLGRAVPAGVVEESLTQAAAVANVLTFSDVIYGIEIIHADAGPLEFTINGIKVNVPAGGWRSAIGGTKAKTITCPAGKNYIVARLV